MTVDAFDTPRLCPFQKGVHCSQECALSMSNQTYNLGAGTFTRVYQCALTVIAQSLSKGCFDYFAFPFLREKEIYIKKDGDD